MLLYTVQYTLLWVNSSGRVLPRYMLNVSSMYVRIIECYIQSSLVISTGIHQRTVVLYQDLTFILAFWILSSDFYLHRGSNSISRSTYNTNRENASHQQTHYATKIERMPPITRHTTVLIRETLVLCILNLFDMGFVHTKPFDIGIVHTKPLWHMLLCIPNLLGQCFRKPNLL